MTLFLIHFSLRTETRSLHAARKLYRRQPGHTWGHDINVSAASELWFCLIWQNRDYSKLTVYRGFLHLVYIGSGACMYHKIFLTVKMIKIIYINITVNIKKYIVMLLSTTWVKHCQSWSFYNQALTNLVYMGKRVFICILHHHTHILKWKWTFKTE